MKLVADTEVAAWLATRPAVEWDVGNSAKSETKPEHQESRYLLLGVTADSRRAALIFARRGDRVRPISCRAMRTKEKEAYDAAT